MCPACEGAVGLDSESCLEVVGDRMTVGLGLESGIGFGDGDGLKVWSSV